MLVFGETREAWWSKTKKEDPHSESFSCRWIFSYYLFVGEFFYSWDVEDLGCESVSLVEVFRWIVIIYVRDEVLAD